MPAKSKAQVRACFAKKDPKWDCKKMVKETPNLKALPQHVKKKKA